MKNILLISMLFVYAIVNAQIRELDCPTTMDTVTSRVNNNINYLDNKNSVISTTSNDSTMKIIDKSIYMYGQNQGVNNIKVVVPDTISQDGSANSGTDYQHQNVYEAFKITSNISTRIQSLAVWVKNTGTITNVTDYIEAVLYTDNAGQPGTQIGTILEQERYGGVTTSFARFDGQIDPLDIVSGTSYWIILHRNAAPVGGNVYLDTDATGTNNHAYSTDGSSWTLTSNKAIRFYLFGQRVAGIYSSGTNYAAIEGIGTTEYGVKGYSVWDYGVVSNSLHNKGLVAGTMYGDAAVSATGNHGSAFIGTSIDNNVMELSTTGDGLGASIYSKLGRGADITSDSSNALLVQTHSKLNTGYAGKFRNYGAGYAIDVETDTNIAGIFYSDLNSAVYMQSLSPSQAAGYAINTGGGYGFRTRANNGISLYNYSTNSWGVYNQSDNSYASVHYNNEATTNAVEGVVRISRGTTGTAAAGIGGKLELYAEDDAGLENEAGRITWTLTDVTNTEEEGNIKIGTLHNAVNVDRTIIGADTLQSGVSSALCRIDLIDGNGAGGIVNYTLVIKSAASDSIQVQTGEIKYSSLNVSAAYVNSIDATDANANYSENIAATTLTEDWTVTTGTNQIFINANFTTSIGIASMRIYYTIENQSRNAILIQ